MFPSAPPLSPLHVAQWSTLHTTQSDRTFSFVTTSPPTSYFLKAAAGITKGAQKPGMNRVIIILQQVHPPSPPPHFATSSPSLSSTSYCNKFTFPFLHLVPKGHQKAGQVSLRHVYEIAKLKSQDPVFAGIPLESICKTIIGSARSMGIEIIR